MVKWNMLKRFSHRSTASPPANVAHFIKWNWIPIPFVNVMVKCVWAFTKKNYMHLNSSRSSIWNFIVNRARWKKIKNKTDTKVEVLFLAIWHTQRNTCDAKRKKFDSLINDNPLFGFALLKTVLDNVIDWINYRGTGLNVNFYCYGVKVPLAI